MSIVNIQNIKVPIDGAPPFEYIIAKQGEISSRQVEVTLLQNNAIYTIPSGATARVNYYKPDGNKVINDCTISNNKVIVTYTQQMLAAAGTGFAEVQLYKDGSVLISASFYTKIVESVNGAGTITSDSESTSFTKLLVETTQARDSAQAARAATEKATDNANTATSNANAATSNATSAANAADKAATTANNAASAADIATTNAKRETENAKNATSAANGAAGNANTATTNANNAANTATAAAKTAQDAAKAVYTDRNYNLLVGEDGAVTLMYNEQ